MYDDDSAHGVGDPDFDGSDALTTSSDESAAQHGAIAGAEVAR